MRSKHEKNYFIQPEAFDNTGRPLDVYPEFVNFLPGTNVRIWYIYEDTYSPLHWHSCIEISYCTEGEYSVTAGDTTYTVSDGGILVIPSELMHTFTAKAPCKGFVHLLGIDFVRTIPSLSRMLSLLNKPLLITKIGMPQLYTAAESRLFQMREAYFSDNYLREAVIDSHFLILLEEIIGSLMQKNPEPARSKFDKRGRYQQTINDILIYVNAHLSEELSIDGFSKLFGLSRSHFMHLFRQYTSYSFVEYLSLRRIQEAERLLTLPDMTLTEIALKVGFGSVSSFTRVFKEVYHALPSDYRKEL